MICELAREKLREKKKKKDEGVEYKRQTTELISNSICPLCGEDLRIETVKGKRDTFFKTYFDGVKKICKTHGILYEQKAGCRDDYD